MKMAAKTPQVTAFPILAVMKLLPMATAAAPIENTQTRPGESFPARARKPAGKARSFDDMVPPWLAPPHPAGRVFQGTALGPPDPRAVTDAPLPKPGVLKDA